MSVSGNYSLHLEKGRAWLIQVMEWITQGKASYKDIIKAATHILLSYSIKLFTHQKGDGFLVHLSTQKQKNIKLSLPVTKIMKYYRSIFLFNNQIPWHVRFQFTFQSNKILSSAYTETGYKTKSTSPIFTI